MLNTFLLTAASLTTALVLCIGAFLAINHCLSANLKRAAETQLLREQATHVAQTRRGDELNSAELTKAHEAQGANKLRTELARLATLEEIEKKLQFKLKGVVSTEAHEADLKKSRTIIAALEDRIEALLATPHESEPAAELNAIGIPGAPAIEGFINGLRVDGNVAGTTV